VALQRGESKRNTIRRVPDEVRLPPHPASVGRARRFVAEQLAAMGISDESGDAELVTSELVTNAVIHARTDITVRVVADDDNEVRVEIVDGSELMPGPRIATAASRNGRGLTLVDHFAPAWGVERTVAGKVVWFTVRQED
jgi:anti-sigma regulatory factor (Ser/Thr protein kinase)